MVHEELHPLNPYKQSESKQISTVKGFLPTPDLHWEKSQKGIIRPWKKR